MSSLLGTKKEMRRIVFSCRSHSIRCGLASFALTGKRQSYTKARKSQ